MLGKRLAVGRTAEVYEWSDGTIIKLFRPKMNHWEYEYAVCDAVYSAGVPSPKPMKHVTVDGRHGLVFERIDGTPMDEELKHNLFRVRALGQRLGTLHAELHMKQSAKDISFLPTAHDAIARGIRTAQAPDVMKESALSQLESLPHADVLCHGDFHPGNVIRGATGDVVIDWMNAVRGNPLADVVRTRLLLTFGSLPTDSRLEQLLFNFVRARFLSGYWSGYNSVKHIEDTWQLWVLPLAVARLSEGISDERKGLLQFINKLTSTLSS